MDIRRLFFLTLLLYVGLPFQILLAQPFEFGAPGYEIDYRPGSSFCLREPWANNGGYAYLGGNVQDVVFDQGPLVITTTATVDPAETYRAPALIDLYFTQGEGSSATCIAMRNAYWGVDEGGDVYYYVDMSGSNSKIVIYAKASAPTTADVSLAYNGLWGPDMIASYKDSVVKPISLTTTTQAYELDFSDWPNRQRVNMYGFYFNDPNITVTIEKVVIGSAARAAIMNHIEGTLYDDINSSCSRQLPAEGGIANVVVKASNGVNQYYALSDSLGHYSIAVDTGDVVYDLQLCLNATNQQLYREVSGCTGWSKTTSGSSQTFCCNDFALQRQQCALLKADLYSQQRRRCFPSVTSVWYRNVGTYSSDAAHLKVIYPEFVKPISSEPAWTVQSGDTLIYELGVLGVNKGGFIQIKDSVVCGIEEIRGMEQCTKAIISPVSFCQIDPRWDSSSVAVTGECLDSIAHFTIVNKGRDMTASSEYRLYSNDTLIFISSFRLMSQGKLEVNYPVDSATIRLEADQSLYHPGKSLPRAFVDGCGYAYDTSYAAYLRDVFQTVPQDDQDEWLSIFCRRILDSYDPNDKAAMPVGIGEDHLIGAGSPIKYTIRFQNTGSDVAYKIKVIDTLDMNLDPASFQEGSSSHPYQLKFINEGDGVVLNFIFDDINLKDSTTSESESHGFVSFYIHAKEDLADDVRLYNQAAIFFDYNSAVVTNTVYHTIGDYVPEDFTKGNKIQVVTGLFDGKESLSNNLNVYPNPVFGQSVQLTFKQSLTNGIIRIVDLSGQEVYVAELQGQQTALDLSSLSSGLYLYSVQDGNETVGRGKLVMK